jgi:hypothetical protein
MAAEAICQLGHWKSALGWLERYRAPLRELPVAKSPIDDSNWKSALGPNKTTSDWEQANARWRDWQIFFAKQLDDRPWRDVLTTWVGRLAPGMSGAATHGVIRTAHAARAMGRRDNAFRRTELANGLAYWASSYEELKAAKPSGQAFKTIADAMNEIPLYREAFGAAPAGRNFVEVLRQVNKAPGFERVKDSLAEQTDMGAALTALTASFARVYLRYGTKRDTLAFIHAVTGPCALRRLAEHVSKETAAAAFPYAWQTAAALYCAYVEKRDERKLDEETKLTREDLAARAIENGDEHAIKFTEVMLAEHAIQPDPIYLAAASSCVQVL